MSKESIAINLKGFGLQNKCDLELYVEERGDRIKIYGYKSNGLWKISQMSDLLIFLKLTADERNNLGWLLWVKENNIQAALNISEYVRHSVSG